MPFLPITKEETNALGWDAPDFVVVTGDAYVDHPTFGTAIISRVLEQFGYRVAILAQPDWRTDRDFTRFGKPKYGFLVNSGNIDSMVAHYTVARRRRKEDAYSPGNRTGLRPDRAVIVYTKKIREIYPDSPVVIGGLEASLRRFAHYDYWDDKIRPSILLDSGADLLTYGMGESQTVEIARRLFSGEPISTITDILGTCYAVPTKEYRPVPAVDCPSFEQVCQNKKEYAVSCRKQQDEQDAVRGRRVIQRHGGKILVQNPPMPPLKQKELDAVYELPYMRTYHPCYESMGGVPAIQEVEFSITHNRGCFGACNFCSIAFHQGRRVTARSEDSVVAEAVELTKNPHFKGYIHDVGGPTANFRLPSCKKQEKNGLCPGRKCLAPKPCANLDVSHKDYLALLRRLRALPGVKKVFVRSGLRFDYIMEDKDDSFFRELVAHHVSGQLKVAPEHCSAAVLDKMGKPHIETYLDFSRKFYQLTQKAGKKQYLVPYLMSSHPGSTLRDAVELALFLKREGIKPEQVQDFYPTPGTVSTCMYYTGIDPFSMKPVFVPRDAHEKAMQRALLQYFIEKNRALVLEALKKAGRPDLIGFSKDCLIKPDGRRERKEPERKQPEQKRRTTRGSDKKQWRGKSG
jgi:uncharacterized radical SAM protein YgiQ